MLEGKGGVMLEGKGGIGLEGKGGIGLEGKGGVMLEGKGGIGLEGKGGGMRMAGKRNDEGRPDRNRKDIGHGAGQKEGNQIGDNCCRPSLFVPKCRVNSSQYDNNSSPNTDTPLPATSSTRARCPSPSCCDPPFSNSPCTARRGTR